MAAKKTAVVPSATTSFRAAKGIYAPLAGLRVAEVP